jgi:mRNA interferase YafQ
MEALLQEETLQPKYKDHWLTGNYAYRRECHIEPDWLLIYKPRNNEIIFERTGTHSDLF